MTLGRDILNLSSRPKEVQLAVARQTTKHLCLLVSDSNGSLSGDNSLLVATGRCLAQCLQSFCQGLWFFFTVLQKTGEPV